MLSLVLKVKHKLVFLVICIMKLKLNVSEGIKLGTNNNLTFGHLSDPQRNNYLFSSLLIIDTSFFVSVDVVKTSS